MLAQTQTHSVCSACDAVQCERECDTVPNTLPYAVSSSSGHSSWHDSDLVGSFACGFKKRHVPQPQAIRMAAG